MPDEVKQYTLLAESTNTKIENDINLLLSKGWKLYGYTWVENNIFLQAMTSDKPAPKKLLKNKKK